jgi:hypothetical protein
MEEPEERINGKVLAQAAGRILGKPQGETRPMAYRLSESMVESAHALALARGKTVPALVRAMLENEIRANPEEVQRGLDALRAAKAL